MVVGLVCLCACGRIAFDATTDACGPVQTFYVDADGDGHGDPTNPLVACTQPADASTTADDCDDRERYRFPGATEVCDGLDNDCSAATVEQCVALCAPARRPAPDDQHAYLLCGEDRTWTLAQMECAAEGFTFAVIDDAAENTWLLAEMAIRFGTVDTMLGGTDAAVEGTWSWPDGKQFWQGDGAGAPVNGLYTRWATNEPNNGGAVPPENCLLQLSFGDWNDMECVTTTRKFACERI